MSLLHKQKSLLMALAATIFLSGCGMNNNQSRTESKNTQTPNTVSSSEQAKETKTKAESKLFGDLGNYQIEKPKTYNDDEFKFSVEYPSAWKGKKSDSKTDTASPDGSPEQGIYISVDNKEFFDTENNKQFNSLYVYHFVSHIDVNNYEDNLTEEAFTTEAGVEGQIYYDKRDGYICIYLTLGEGSFYGARINISEELFKKYKEQIYGILRSIKIPND